MSYYPVFLDIKGRRCVIVGGGAVALRKVSMLLEHEAQIEIISPNLCSELSELVAHGKARAFQRQYKAGDLEGAFLVIAATDDSQVNEKVASDAEEQRVLVNVVDVPPLSNFIVPSYLNRGDLSIAISTSGKSPALARKIRLDLEQYFGQEYADLILLVEEVRSELKQQKITISAEIWQRALDLNVLLDLLRQGQRAEAKKRLLHALRMS